ASTSQIELSIIGDEVDIASQMRSEFLRQVYEGFVSLVDSKSISKFSELGTSFSFYGLYKGSDEANSLLIDPNMGAGYFYARALYNNRQRQARNYDMLIDNTTAGVATSLYKSAYLAKINESSSEVIFSDLDTIPGIVQQYDKELYTPGLGSILNERVFMRLGLGRLYKDELGFLPSVTGTIGAVLDKTYLYLNPNANFPGITDPFKPLNLKDSHYRDRLGPTGIFEAGFSEITNLLEAATKGILFYMIVGEPLAMIMSETIKKDFELGLSDSLSLNLDEFNSLSSRLKRKSSLSFNDFYNSPLSARMEVLSTMEELNKVKGQYFGVENPGMSIYHFSSVYLRGRSGILLNNVFKPFLMDIVNPYDPLDLESNRGFSDLIDRYIDEVIRPVDLNVIKPNAPELDKLIITRTDIHRGLYERNIPRQLVQGMKIDEIIGYQYARREFVASATHYFDNLNLSSPSLTTEVNKLKQFITNLGNEADFSSNNLALLFKELERMEKATTDVTEIEQIQSIRNRLINIGNQIDDPVTALNKARNLTNLDLTREGKLIADINFEIINEGIDRSSAVARRLQDLLDEIPLNPLNWRVFNKYRTIRGMTGQELERQGYLRVTTGDPGSEIVIPRVKVIGEFFSFTDLTYIMRELLVGRGGVMQHIARSEVFSDRELWRTTLSNTNFDNLSHVDKVRRAGFELGFDLKARRDSIHTLWNATFGYAWESSKRVIDKYRYLKGSLL
ncbi:hypothetical protein V6O07_23595, partial [Arthrospira platensis SPKY2]